MGKLNLKSKELEEMVKEFKRFFPREKKGCINIENVIEMFKNKEMLSKENVEKKLKRHKRTVRGYLNLLENLNILITNKEGTRKYWKLNPNIN